MQITRLCTILIASALMMTELATAAPAGSIDTGLYARGLNKRSVLRARNPPSSSGGSNPITSGQTSGGNSGGNSGAGGGQPRVDRFAPNIGPPPPAHELPPTPPRERPQIPDHLRERPGTP